MLVDYLITPETQFGARWTFRNLECYDAQFLLQSPPNDPRQVPLLKTLILARHQYVEHEHVPALDRERRSEELLCTLYLTTCEQKQYKSTGNLHMEVIVRILEQCKADISRHRKEGDEFEILDVL